jgi:uncharacterized membrane protein
VRAESLHAILLLALVVGLGLAIFAYAESIQPSLQNECSVNSYFSCHKIDSSGLTTTLGIPDYAWGIGGFVLLLALDVPLYRTWRRDLLMAVVGVSAVGVGLSAYLAYVEIVLINGICPVCLSAYLANLVAFGAAFGLWWIGRSGDKPDAPGTPAPERGGAAANEPPT